MNEPGELDCPNCGERTENDLMRCPYCREPLRLPEKPDFRGPILIAAVLLGVFLRSLLH